MALVREDQEASSLLRPGSSTNIDASIVAVDASSVLFAAYSHHGKEEYLDEAFQLAKHAIDSPAASRAAQPFSLLRFAEITEATYHRNPTLARCNASKLTWLFGETMAEEPRRTFEFGRQGAP